MHADQTPPLPAADATPELRPVIKTGGLNAFIRLVDVYVEQVSNAPTAEERQHSIDRIVELSSIGGDAIVKAVRPLLSHPNRDTRLLAMETVGEHIDADPEVKFEAISKVLRDAKLPEYQADALFGILHIADLPTELRFAAAAPYVVSPSAEVRETAIAVLLKHPEIVNGAIYDDLCDIFEGGTNHKDPQVEADASRALQNLRGFYAANMALGDQQSGDDASTAS